MHAYHLWIEIFDSEELTGLIINPKNLFCQFVKFNTFLILTKKPQQWIKSD